MVLWIAILFFALLLFLSQKVSIDLSYWREGKKDLLKVILRGPFGIPLYRTERSMTESALGKGYLPQLGQRSNQRLSFLKYLIPLAKVHQPILWCITKRARLEKFVWKTKFGTPDAALTGMGVGIAWIVHGWVVAFLHNRGWLIEPESIEFVPVFTETYFYTSFHCIVSIRIVHVITAQLRWLKLKLRQRKR